MRLKALLLTFVLMLTLCSCSYMGASTVMREDGSSTSIARLGYTTDEWNTILQENPDVLKDMPPAESFIVDGTSYTGWVNEQECANLDEFNVAFDGWATMTAGDKSFTLTVEGGSSTEDSGEYIDMPPVISEWNLQFPYPVTQTAGPTTGVTIGNGTLHIDLLTVGDGNTRVFYIGDLNSFTDVTADAWYYAAVQYGKDTGLVNGYPDGSFGPEHPLTKAALCQVLANTCGATDLTTSDYWAYGVIEWCGANGIVDTTAPITPENYDVAVTRQDALTAFIKTYEVMTGLEVDRTARVIPDINKVDLDARPYIYGAYNLGITSGVDAAGTFSPETTLTRAQLCQIYYNLQWAPVPVS